MATKDDALETSQRYQIIAAIGELRSEGGTATAYDIANYLELDMRNSSVSATLAAGEAAGVLTHTLVDNPNPDSVKSRRQVRSFRYTANRKVSTMCRHIATYEVNAARSRRNGIPGEHPKPKRVQTGRPPVVAIVIQVEGKRIPLTMGAALRVYQDLKELFGDA